MSSGDSNLKRRRGGNTGQSSKSYNTWTDYEEDLEESGEFNQSIKKTTNTSSATLTSSEEKGSLLDYSKRCILKQDNKSRPIWVCPDGHIFLETFSAIYKQASDFLVAIAEPVCRPQNIHEYQLTPYSLYAAVSVGLETNDIITVLGRLSKLALPKEVEQFVRQCTQSYGKVKLVLQKNKYFVESAYPEVLEFLLKDSSIATARIKPTLEESVVDPKTGFIINKEVVTGAQISGGLQANQSLDPVLKNDALSNLLEEEEEDTVNNSDQHFHSFEIDPQQVEEVKKRCIQLDYPVLEEYDFRNDTVNPNLNIDLKPTTMIRPYQEKSLSKMFGNGRARSGIIVLPCGAGKSLSGITAACTVKKSILVLCTSAVSVEQWKYQFKLWSNIEERQISKFTSDNKEKISNVAGVTITTYTMVAFGGRRSAESLKIMNEITNREWGLVLLDEVHVVPAAMFRKVLTVTKAHCKLGLTATLLREDEKIQDLNFLIGPKLYEANWLDLQKAGFLANVSCSEVWCPMTAEFYKEYLINDSQGKKKLLYTMNPNKFRACEYLIRFHEQRGDKIIVFSDNVYALQKYAKGLGRYFIYGPTSGHERMSILSKFQHDPTVRTIFISKVGDTSIDIPEATVIIQVSSHYGSRRQEAQRLGRILRPKPKSDGLYNAFFYSLVSKDTQEMYYSTKRQQFLIDQGYSFKVISELPGIDQEVNLKYSSKQDQLDLLAQVLGEGEDSGKNEILEEDFDDITRGAKKSKSSAPTVSRTTGGSTRALSGGNDMNYMEYQAPAIYKSIPTQHALFKQRAKNKQ
ncbi:transcription factor IIH subunit [Dictyostelium discoideum AX4]|uniref:General transcription and DNA repair factor IIH helicase/translocase subunit XPB n=1 Tax=Dictyostelium discoideum TaxID=44689 RepID=ERCC3_DICDI|nr:transcription factor IIH subunit [Dictyostelium discoideum AX4]O00835.1 RecName: Full=General transcription and DNA repair factor IIH helicase subunit XPB; Short=TFIIH subunit XPB; AltName: Full=DNA excision repair cross-complementing protein-3 homolog; AltName: Full=DNA repair helicase repB; AltName: Full=DNA repair protein B [Dictyostelium discoideum]AAB62732.1 RepB [Dictyostelium discoideum]EAL67966.1 transcription factor IIH subunit [Dictyostelium discoideum AX4]|eukprot:XP_647819.1 transcription factor IIH subunit [Dictyostelium discoideum AX4]